MFQASKQSRPLPAGFGKYSSHGSLSRFQFLQRLNKAHVLTPRKHICSRTLSRPVLSIKATSKFIGSEKGAEEQPGLEDEFPLPASEPK